MSMYVGKWCKYCRKADHNTNECWSTHAVDPAELTPEPPGGWLGVMRAALAAHAKAEKKPDGTKDTP